MADETQTYYAKSMFSDPVMIVAFLQLALQLGEVKELITMLMPEKGVHIIGAAIALLTLYLRVFHAERPVAAIAPGNSKPVEVQKLEEKKAV